MARLKGFQKLTSIDKALQIFFQTMHIKKQEVISLPLDSALYRVLARDVNAPEDLPRFDRSAVDGYAVRGRDTSGASQFKPKTLRITEENEIKMREAKQVWTGNSIPRGADAVVMLEDTSRTGDAIEVCIPVAPGENVSQRGEDVRKGEVAIEGGTRLKPQHLGLLAALGVNNVDVVKKPRVGVLVTGNELVEIGVKPRGNQIHDSNRLVLSTLVQESGGDSVDLGIAKDDSKEILEKLSSGLEKVDLVITSGGTSVGGSDIVPDVVDKIGRPGIVVHGVAMRPAMPTALGVVDGRPVVVLPGNPVAAMIGFEVFARPLIAKLTGQKQMSPRCVVEAKMTRGITTTLGRRNFVRVRVFQQNRELLAEPVSARGSSMISTMTRSNGYVVVPEDREGLQEGEIVSVKLFDDLRLADQNV